MTNGAEPKKGGDGCAKAIGIGCLVMLLLVAGSGLLAFKFRKQIGRYFVAKTTLVASEAIIGNSRMPAEEREKAMAPIRELAVKIRSGEVSLEQAARIAEALAQGPLFALMAARGAEMQYLEPSELPDEEKEAGRITLSRFARALTEKKIDEKETEEVLDKITIKTPGAEGKDNVQMKQTLTTEELRDWLKTMKDAADAAGIEDKLFEVDIPAEIRKAIDAGLKEPERGSGEVASDQ